ncbi:MAG: tetratricopeptide repeat protein, partial [Lachnospiraceae bacterium]|nr:tetratricopeptide repeat protein [Lachnospiraceae bacterium]
MKCIYCGATIGSEEYCTNCGADLTLPRRIVRISNLLYNRALEKAQVRDLSGAISLLQRSLKFNKENTDARNLLGLCYFETGEVVNALVEWVISNNLSSRNNLASQYIKTLQSSKNRLDQYNTAIRKYNQSIAYCRQGNEDMALMQLRKVVNQNPKFVRAYQLLALLYMRAEQWEKARGLLKKASRIDNTNTTTLRYLTEVEESTGK